MDISTLALDKLPKEETTRWTSVQSIALYLIVTMPVANLVAFFFDCSALRQLLFTLTEFCLIAIFIRLKKRSLTEYLNLKSVTLITCILCIGVEVCWYFLEYLLFHVFHLPSSHHLSKEILKDPGSAIIFSTLLYPIVEEVSTRGFVFKSFEYNNPWIGIVVISLCWTIFHWHRNVYELGFIFIGGIILGLARMRTKSIVPTIVMHSALNSLGVISFYLHNNS